MGRVLAEQYLVRRLNRFASRHFNIKAWLKHSLVAALNTKSNKHAVASTSVEQIPQDGTKCRCRGNYRLAL